MIPQPVSMTTRPGSCEVRPGAPVAAGPELGGVAAWLRETLPAGCGGVGLRIDPALHPEGYALTTGPEGIDIAGGSAAGVFYGAQTLRQLLPPAALRRAPIPAGLIPAGPVSVGPVSVGSASGEPASGGGWAAPCVTISDEPRFGWRGVMLDVARHFMPVADVLRLVDLAAFHKLNVLHLHLTDDQGWRIEVPGWPRLTSAGAWRSSTMLGSRVHERYDGRPHGGFYTADDLREIVAYAKARFVTVVPEVDMPGHMQAAVAAYPELGNGFAGPVRTAWGVSDHVLNVGAQALDFCRAVLDHVCDIFPSPVIGIGGDECPTAEWETSPAARAVIARFGLAGTHALGSWFAARMAEHLATRGRRVYGWDEILAGGAPPGAVIAAWRGVEPTRVAARAGHQVVACPDISTYLDYRQSAAPDEPTPVGTLLTLAGVYAFEPVPAGLADAEAALVIGGQANLWTEHMESARRVDYMAFPRLCALAEAVWSPAG